MQNIEAEARGGPCTSPARWGGAWELGLRRGEQTATVREGEEAGFLRGGWVVTGRTPRVTTDAEAARAAALGWDVSVGTGNFFHRTLRIPAHTPAEEAARALAAYRRETRVFDALNYGAEVRGN
jgi:hypothetical protein